MGIMSKFPSKYLKGDDVEAGEICTVSDVKDEEVGFERELKPVLFLKEHDRGIVLNKTNATALVKVFGDDEKLWPGKRVVLTTELVRFKGETTNAIRLHPAPEPKSKKQAAAEMAAAVGDEIPF